MEAGDESAGEINVLHDDGKVKHVASSMVVSAAWVRATRPELIRQLALGAQMAPSVLAQDLQSQSSAASPFRAL